MGYGVLCFNLNITNVERYDRFCVDISDMLIFSQFIIVGLTNVLVYILYV